MDNIHQTKRKAPSWTPPHIALRMAKLFRFMCGSREGWTWVRTPSEKNHKYIGFPSNTGPDPLKKSQSYQASIQYWAIISPLAKRHLNGVLLAGRWWSDFSGIWIHKSTTTKKRSQSWTPSEKTFWIRTWDCTQNGQQILIVRVLTILSAIQLWKV